jgi:hypothetical protein
VKSAHTEASAEACGARPGSTAGLPPALPRPAILPLGSRRLRPPPLSAWLWLSPAARLSQGAGRGSPRSLREPVLFDHVLDPTPWAPDLPEVRSRPISWISGSGRDGSRCSGACGARVPGCVVALRRHTIRGRMFELRRGTRRNRNSHQHVGIGTVQKFGSGLAMTPKGMRRLRAANRGKSDSGYR